MARMQGHASNPRARLGSLRVFFSDCALENKVEMKPVAVHFAVECQSGRYQSVHLGCKIASQDLEKELRNFRVKQGFSGTTPMTILVCTWRLLIGRRFFRLVFLITRVDCIHVLFPPMLPLRCLGTCPFQEVI